MRIGRAQQTDLRPGLIDVAVAAIALAMSLSTTAFDAADHNGRLPATAVAVQIITAVFLLWRRSAPTTVWFLVGVGSVVYGLADWADPLIPFMGFIALASVFEFAPQRTRTVLLGATAILAAVGTAAVGDSSGLDWWTSAFVVIAAPLSGAYLRTRRELIAELRTHADLLEARRIHEIDEARHAERARVARELHDVVAHHVTLVVLQAEAAAGAATMTNEHRRTAFDAIARCGRDAMSELRVMIGVLRNGEPAPTAPVPGLGRLDDLLDRVRSSGVDVTAEVSAVPHELSPVVDTAAFRVVQESLTNVMKHAPMAHASVHIDVDSDQLVIAVADDGPSPSSFRPGNGLIGLRERVELLGGRFTCGPAATGFAVCARLPVMVS